MAEKSDRPLALLKMPWRYEPRGAGRWVCGGENWSAVIEHQNGVWHWTVKLGHSEVRRARSLGYKSVRLASMAAARAMAGLNWQFRQLEKRGDLG